VHTYCACVSSTLVTRSWGSAWPSTCIASPLLAPPPLIVTFDSASRASSLSRDKRAITRVAASFWYRAVLSSCRVCASCCLSVCVSSINASHSFWKALSSAGIDVRLGARGVTTWGDLSSIRSSTERSSPVTGSVWFSAMCASIRRFSKTLPLLREATGSRGASPEIAQSMLCCWESCEDRQALVLGEVPATFWRGTLAPYRSWRYRSLTSRHAAIRRNLAQVRIVPLQIQGMPAASLSFHFV